MNQMTSHEENQVEDTEQGVSDLAHRILKGQNVDVTPLFQALVGRDLAGQRDRAIAALALGCAPLTEPERNTTVKLLRRILADGERYDQQAVIPDNIALAATASACVVAAPSVYLLLSGGSSEAITAAFLAWAFLTAALVGVMWCIRAAKAVSCPKGALRERACITLGVLGDPQATREIATAYFDSNTEVRKAASVGLHRLLPLLTARHYGLFGAESVTAIARLASQQDRGLVKKALEAVEKVGTPAAIPNVERALAKAPTQELRDTAQRVLQVLREREMLERIANTLLRPSAAPVNRMLVRASSAPANETLLRPAGNAEVREELLLRRSEVEK